MIKVLYLGGVGPFGGASRSLYEAVRALPSDSFEPYFLMPSGTAMDVYRRVAADSIAVGGVSRFDHTRDSHYRGTRWMVVAREVKNIPSTIAGLLKARRRWPDIDLIHVNEITEIIPALLAKRLWRVPLVVHVRALVHNDAKLLRTRALTAMLRKADAIVAIDQNVRARLPADLPVEVIHNAFSPEPQEKVDTAYLARLDALKGDSLKVGFVGNFMRSKGLVELIEAARIVAERGGNVEYFIVGGGLTSGGGIARRVLRMARLDQNVEDTIRDLIARYELGHIVHLLGPTRDIQRVYPHMDVLAFPSQLDAPGRPVFEAAFYGIPSIVATKTPMPDTLEDGQTGLAIARPEPELLAEAILACDRDRARVATMGENAHRLAIRNFRPGPNVAKLAALYRRLLPRQL